MHFLILKKTCQKLGLENGTYYIFCMMQAVVAKLRPCGQISYAEVARAAEVAGRRRLATMLLDLEPLAADQVKTQS